MLDGEEAGVSKLSRIPRPEKTEHTHVCRLCWSSGGEGEDSAGETSPALSGDGIKLFQLGYSDRAGGSSGYRRGRVTPITLGPIEPALQMSFDSPFSIWFPKLGSSPKDPICFPIPGGSRGRRGSGEEEDPRGEERADMLPATDMSLTCRASYCYSDWLCCVLSSAILSGHGY